MNNEGAGLAPLTEVMIDLGDGSGVQVFKADTPNALVAKLAEAQTNATRKIREQAAALRAYDAAPNLTEDEKRQLAERLLADYDSAVREFIDKGAEDKVREQEEERRREEERIEREFRDAEEFVRETPEYYVTPKNAQKLLKWIETQGLTPSVESLRAAYEDLSGSGLLEVRRQGRQGARGDASVTESTPDSAEPEQRPSPLASLMRRKVVGGLSAKRSAPIAPRRYAPEPERMDAERMTTDQLRNLALRSIGAF